MNWNRGHSPPFQGGVAATPRSGRGGCVSDENHPGCASQGTGPFLGGAQPPLLGKEGNALDSNSQPLSPRTSLLENFCSFLHFRAAVGTKHVAGPHGRLALRTGGMKLVTTLRTVVDARVHDDPTLWAIGLDGISQQEIQNETNGARKKNDEDGPQRPVHPPQSRVAVAVARTEHDDSENRSREHADHNLEKQGRHLRCSAPRHEQEVTRKEN